MAGKSITCKCGQPISGMAILEHARYPRLFGPDFIHLKYQCDSCQRRGEAFIKIQDWDPATLDLPKAAPTLRATSDTWPPPIGEGSGPLEAVFGNVTIRLEGSVATVRSAEARNPRNLIASWIFALVLATINLLTSANAISQLPRLLGMFLVLPIVCAVSTAVYFVSPKTTRHHTIDVGRGIVGGSSGGHYLDQIQVIAVVPAARGRHRLALTKADGTRLWLGSGRQSDIAQAAAALSQQTGIPTA